MKTARIRIRKDQAALLIVDIQPDFFPGGALPVAHANEILRPLRKLMNSRCFHLIVAAQDWHPPGHISFASSHRGRKPMETIDLYGHQQTLWPDHCVQGTPGAELHRGLPWEKATAIIRKATDPATDSYSAFRNNWNSRGNRPPTGLSGYLKDRGVDEVFLCGLALDFCVRWSAEDALQEDFRTFVIWDLCRSIEPSSDAAVRRDLIHRGAKVISMRSLLPSH
jgi:nicotinamidase/pyrazinamidase